MQTINKNIYIKVNMLRNKQMSKHIYEILLVLLFAGIIVSP